MKTFKFNCPCCGQGMTFAVVEKDDPINGQKFDYVVFEDAVEKKEDGR